LALVTEAEDQTRMVMLQLRSAQDAGDRAELREYFEIEQERLGSEHAALMASSYNSALRALIDLAVFPCVMPPLSVFCC
jgi:hypothetical protein